MTPLVDLGGGGSTVLLLLLLVAIGFASGLLGSLIGIGGGLFLVPTLVLGFGLDIHFAVAASLLAVIANSSGSASTYVEQGLTNLRLGMFLETTTVIGGLLGALLSVTVLASHSDVLALGFVPAVVVGAILMFRAPRAGPDPDAPSSPLADRLDLGGEYEDEETGARIRYRTNHPAEGLSLAGVAGFGSGLLGVGGGIFNVPAMNAVMNVPLRIASATSLFMIGVTASAGVLVYFLAGDLLLFVAAPVAFGSLLGSVVGSYYQFHAGSRWIRAMFIVVLLVAAVLMAARGVGYLQ